ncbi:MAG: hypothetical protein ACQR33_00355 [Candidatus Saccharibacteria bacterium]
MGFVRLVRNIDAGRLFDTFLVTSVVTVLVTRLYLRLSGYPQIGGDGLHIAHLLPGGLLMLVALFTMMGSINRSGRDVSAYIGGVGFGLFWDELGKFITKDNNYFFKPAVGIMYVFFVALYLITRYIIRRTYHSQDYLANAANLAAEGIIGELDPREYARAKELLAMSDPAHPLYKSVAALIEHAKPTKDYRPFVLNRWLAYLHGPFRQLVAWSWFRRALLTLFYMYGAGVVTVLIISLFNDHFGDSVFALISAGGRTNTIATLSVIASAWYIVRGAWNMQLGRIHRALQRFETALLLNIFVTQVFLFFKYQLTALVVLVITLGLLVAVRVLLSETKQHAV